VKRAAEKSGLAPFSPDALAALVPLLACPACGDGDAALAIRADALACGRCKARWPLYKSGAATIPWLFRDAEAVRLEWRARFNGFLQTSAADSKRLEQALRERGVNALAAERLATLHGAKEARKKQVSELLAPLKLGAPRTQPNLDRTGLLHSKLPKQQALLSYYGNIFRDWSWDNGESESQLECVRRVLPSAFKAGKALTLGAGACRLSYDLHRELGAELSWTSFRRASRRVRAP
jgi:hypothetical protein